MSKKLYEESSIRDIATAIREKTALQQSTKLPRWGLLCEHYLEAKRSNGTSVRKPFETTFPL